MWVLFRSFLMFSSVYQLDLVNVTCVVLSNLWWSINKNHIYFGLVMIIGKACLVVLSLNTWVFLIVLWNSWEKIEDVVQSIWNKCLWCLNFISFVLWSSPNHTPIKYRCLIKESSQITPTFLSIYESLMWLFNTSLNDHIGLQKLCFTDELRMVIVFCAHSIISLSHMSF